MANLSTSLLVNQIIDVSLPGIPVPNTGVSLSTPSAIAISPVSLLALQAGNTNNFFQLKGANAGTGTVTVTSHNASGVSFTDTINVTVTNPTPDATASGITVSTPHA